MGLFQPCCGSYQVHGEKGVRFVKEVLCKGGLCVRPYSFAGQVIKTPFLVNKNSLIRGGFFLWGRMGLIFLKKLFGQGGSVRVYSVRNLKIFEIAL